MKKIIGIIICLFGSYVYAGDYSNNIFQNANNITRGILPNARIDWSSAASVENLMVTMATASVDINGLKLFRSTAQNKLDEWDSYKSTAYAGFDRYSLFVTTAETKIDSWKLSQTTTSSNIDRYSIFVSSFETSEAKISSLTVYSAITSTTGFIGNGSGLVKISSVANNVVSIDQINATGTRDGTTFLSGDGTFKSPPASGGGGSGVGGYNYYSFSIGTYPHISASSQTVNCSSNTQYCFNQAKTFFGTNKGDLRVMNGTYYFLIEYGQFQLPSNIKMSCEEGAIITQSGNFNVMSVSGTVDNLQIRPDNAWLSKAFVHVNSSSTINGLKCKKGNIGNLNTDSTENAVVLFENTDDAKLFNYEFIDNTMGGTAPNDNGFLYLKKSNRNIVDGVKISEGNKVPGFDNYASSFNIFNNWSGDFKADGVNMMGVKGADSLSGFNTYSNLKFNVPTCSNYFWYMAETSSTIKNSEINHSGSGVTCIYLYGRGGHYISNSVFLKWGGNVINVVGVNTYLHGIRANGGGVVGDSGANTKVRDCVNSNAFASDTP